MIRHIRPLLMLGAAVLVAASPAMAGQAKPATPATPATPASQERPRLIAPVRGEVELGHTRPTSRREGNMVVTTFKVMNLASGAVAGLKVDEFWYDRNRQLVGGAPSFRYRRPLQPGEIIDIELRTPAKPEMFQPQWKFEHANGTVKPTLMTEAQMKARGAKG